MIETKEKKHVLMISEKIKPPKLTIVEVTNSSRLTTVALIHAISRATSHAYTLCEATKKITFNSTPAGTTIGLNDKECGHIGVTMMAGTLGWIMDAPAATAYAVLPVGVEIIKPAKTTS